MCCFKELFYAFRFHYASYVNKSNRFFFPWVWKWNKFFKFTPDPGNVIPFGYTM